jgi:uncharacterized protein
MMERSMRRIVWTVLAMGVLGFSVIVGLSYRAVSVMVHRVTYKPARAAMILKERAWLHEQMQARDVEFTTQDGVKLIGMLFVRPGALRTIVLCHGHKSAKEMLRPLINFFPNDTILIFDFRAHGQSEGSISTLGWQESLDVLAAVKFLTTCFETKNLPIYGLGVSMGAASLLHAAAQGAPFKALVLDSTLARLSDQIYDTFSRRTSLPRFPFLYIAQWIFAWEAGCLAYKLDLCEDVKWVHCPLLIIHSRDDSIIPFTQVEQLVACVQGPKEVWFVDHAYHGRMSKEYRDAYQQRVQAFFDAVTA